MNAIDLVGGDVRVDATLIAADLGLDSADVLGAMRAGRLTALCERGVDHDAGRYRVTFYHGRIRLRLVVDSGGHILERSVARLRHASRTPATKRLRESPSCETASGQTEHSGQSRPPVSGDDHDT